MSLSPQHLDDCGKVVFLGRQTISKPFFSSAAAIESHRSQYSRTQTYNQKSGFIPKSSIATTISNSQSPNFLDSIFVKDHRSIKDILGVSVEDQPKQSLYSTLSLAPEDDNDKVIHMAKNSHFETINKLFDEYYGI